MSKYKSVSEFMDTLKMNSEGVQEVIQDEKLNKNTLPKIKIEIKKDTERGLELELPKLAPEHKLTRFTRQVIPNSKDILCKNILKNRNIMNECKKSGHQK